MRKNSGPDRASIGFNALEFHLNPNLFSLKDRCAGKGRILFQIDDQHVDIAVIVEIPESASGAGVGLGNSGAGNFEQFFEGVVVAIAGHRARRLGSRIATAFAPLSG